MKKQVMIQHYTNIRTVSSNVVCRLASDLDVINRLDGGFVEDAVCFDILRHVLASRNFATEIPSAIQAEKD